MSPLSATSSYEFALLRQRAGLSISEVAAQTGYAERTIYRWENGVTQPRKAALDALRREVDGQHCPVDQSGQAFRFIDLFAGIGGLRRGFEAIGGRCVFTSEWDRYCQQTYLANFETDHPIAGDIAQIDATDIPSHDVLLAGFPCQPFSLAGVSKKNALGREHGFRCEAQGTLFFDVARIIDHHRPPVFLLENVKNLVNHDRGHTFRVIHETLTKELGYHVSWKVIDAKGSVPQHRERIFIAGFRDDPDGFNLDDITLPDTLSGPRLKSILHPEDGTQRAEGHFTQGRNAAVASKYVLSDHLWRYLQDYAEKHRKKGNGFGYGLVGPDDIARTLSARYYKDGSEILIRRPEGPPRRLTPRECARLMGFDRPDGSEWVIPVSDTQAYKQFGNAVVVPVVEAVASYMKPAIEAALQKASEEQPEPKVEPRRMALA